MIIFFHGGASFVCDIAPITQSTIRGSLIINGTRIDALKQASKAAQDGKGKVGKNKRLCVTCLFIYRYNKNSEDIFLASPCI